MSPERRVKTPHILNEINRDFDGRKYSFKTINDGLVIWNSLYVASLRRSENVFDLGFARYRSGESIRERELFIAQIELGRSYEYKNFELGKSMLIGFDSRITENSRRSLYFKIKAFAPSFSLAENFGVMLVRERLR